MEEFDIEVGISEGVVKEPDSPYQGHQFSDYVLLGKDGKPMAVVEAKKTAADAAIGREQAKQYCLNINKKSGGDLPFCFYTNGHNIFFWDIDNYPPKKVHGSPTRDDLERYQYIRKSRKPLAEELINTKIAGRDYQIRSIRAVMEAIEKRKRKLLLVMATGTGKTRTCIALVDALMRAGWAERTLFLVDRIALREVDRITLRSLLPEYIIGYSTGENETLSLPFFKMSFIKYDEYENRLKDLSGYNTPEARLIYLNKVDSQAIF